MELGSGRKLDRLVRGPAMSGETQYPILFFLFHNIAFNPLEPLRRDEFKIVQRPAVFSCPAPQFVAVKFMSESEHRLIFVMDPCYQQINGFCLSAGASA